MKQRLLIVDDEEPILFAMREYFSTCGYRVDCAREIDEAEVMLLGTPYAAVIADLRLSGSQSAEGLEIIGYVRERCPQTRVVLLTAYGSTEVECEARRRGVDAFLHKPMPLPAVAQIVKDLLQAAP